MLFHPDSITDSHLLFMQCTHLFMTVVTQQGNQKRSFATKTLKMAVNKHIPLKPNAAQEKAVVPHKMLPTLKAKTPPTLPAQRDPPHSFPTQQQQQEPHPNSSARPQYQSQSNLLHSM